MNFRVPTVDDPLRVLALGAGVQSSYLFLASCEGELPYLDCAIFADTGNEPATVYRHLDWLETVGAKAAIPIIRCSVGDLKQDVIAFRQDRVSRDGKRWASVPFYVKNKDGSRGQINRQCTPTYKIEPMDRVIREQLLGLKRGQRSQPVPLIEQWIGISSDEGQRCSFPGVFRTIKTHGVDLFGNKIEVAKRKVWGPLRWKSHVYPLCGWRFTADRKVYDVGYLPRQFDRDIRIADHHGQSKRKMLVGLPFVHDSLVPLDMVDLDVDDGKRGAGCGIARGIQGSFAGMCGV